MNFVLGTSSAHCLLTTAKLFGNTNSVYLDSPIGILFMGDVNEALKSIGEIDCLEDRTEFRLASFLCLQPREHDVDEFEENLNDKDANFVVKINKHSNKDLNKITDQALAEQLRTMRTCPLRNIQT